MTGANNVHTELFEEFSCQVNAFRVQFTSHFVRCAHVQIHLCANSLKCCDSRNSNMIFGEIEGETYSSFVVSSVIYSLNSIRFCCFSTRTFRVEESSLCIFFYSFVKSVSFFFFAPSLCDLFLVQNKSSLFKNDHIFSLRLNVSCSF